MCNEFSERSKSNLQISILKLRESDIIIEVDKSDKNDRLLKVIMFTPEFHFSSKLLELLTRGMATTFFV